MERSLLVFILYFVSMSMSVLTYIMLSCHLHSVGVASDLLDDLNTLDEHMKNEIHEAYFDWFTTQIRHLRRNECPSDSVLRYGNISSKVQEQLLECMKYMYRLAFVLFREVMVVLEEARYRMHHPKSDKTFHRISSERTTIMQNYMSIIESKTTASDLVAENILNRYVDELDGAYKADDKMVRVFQFYQQYLYFKFSFNAGRETICVSIVDRQLTGFDMALDEIGRIQG